MNIKLSLILVVGLIFSSCKENLKKPNIILIMTDDQGWYDVGFNGNNEIKTPNIDKLAKIGVILNRFYAASAVCSPTRASVITGRNPLRINIPTANVGHMKDEEITLPEILKEYGYTTGHFGKWHLGTLTKLERDANRGGKDEYNKDYSIPSMNGYDIFFCTESKVPTYDPMVYPTSFEKGESMRFGWKAIKNKDSTKLYGTAYWKGIEEKAQDELNGDDSKIIMDQTIPFIENAVQFNKPFFTTIWTHTPHLPVVSDSLHRSYYDTLDLKKRIYYGTITAMDEQIGRLWAKLEELGIQDETILWFCSDNGPENGTPGSAGKYRERKRSLYEGGVRVPAFMIWKNNIEGGKKLDFPSVTSDYLPTILDILNIPYPDRPLDGTSLLGALKGEKKEREKAIGFLFGNQISWVDDTYKLISVDNGQSFELYDLIKDEAEKENIIQNYPEIAMKMKVDLNDWLHSVENSKNGGDYK
jgi:arylsulfatase A-like enzyme